MTWGQGLARSVSFTVKVNGTTRAHTELSWAQDITSDLPESVTAGGAVAFRSGTIVWAKENLAETRTPSPWYRGPYWIPEIGDAVTIDAHNQDGDTLRVFTGIIDTVEGDAYGNRTSRIVAEVERNNKVCRYLSLTRYGSPVAAPTGNGKIRQQATTNVWLIHEIIREIGYNAVPPKPADSKLVLDAPLQGSTYIYSTTSNRNARLVVSHRAGNDSLAPIWAWGADGFGISNAVIEWVPNTGLGSGAGTVGVSMLAYQGHNEDALLTVSHGGTDKTFLRIRGDKVVRITTRVNGSDVSQTFSTPLPSGPGPHRVSAVFRAGGVDVRYGGNTYTATMPTPGTAITRIRLDAGASSCVSGVQVWHPSTTTDHNAPTWTPTAKIRYGTGTYSTVCTPSVRDRRARDVLEEYSDALLSPIWVDADGVLQIVTGKGLHSQAPSVTVDALNEVAELGYKIASLDHRPTVEVSYQHAHHSTPNATKARTTVWEGPSGQLPGDLSDPETSEEFIETPDDEEWINLSDPATMTRLTLDNVAAFHTGVGSWWGLAGSVDSNQYLINTAGSQTVETLTPWAWKVSTYNNVEYGAATKVPEIGSIRAHFHGMGLPVIRSLSKVKYESRTVSATAGSDPYKGVLAHDMGKWGTTTAAANDLCQWIHGMVSTPTPVLEELVLSFNPLIDVGIKAKINAQGVFGADFEALILSFEHSPYNGTTTVTARVTKVTAYAEAIDDVDYAHIGQSLARWDADRAGMTLDEVTANPYIL